MLIKYPYVMLGIFSILCIMIGWSVRGYVENTNPLGKAMAWGYDEISNTWNRIRVDEKGYVMCHKEEK